MPRDDAIRNLLLRRTAWHGYVDAWLAAADLRGAPNVRARAVARMSALKSMADERWVLPSERELPGPGMNLCYLLLSPSSGKLYIGSTKNLRKRLNQHRSACAYIGGAINTHSEVDWVVVSYVHGFQAGKVGRTNAYAFESRWQHTRWRLPRTMDSCIDLGRMLIASSELQQYDAGQHRCPLSMELFT